MASTESSPLGPAAPPHPLRVFWGYFCENRGALAGLTVFVVVCTVALGADFLAPHPPDHQYREHFLEPPFFQDQGSLEFPLGTDAVGRDILSRIMHGARYSLTIGLIVVALSVTLGITLGLVAAFFRGAIEIVVMRAMDIMLSLPSLLLAIDGKDVAGARPERIAEIRRQVQIVFQDPFGSLNPRKKVGAIVGEPLVINTAMTAAERELRVRDMLTWVGLRPEHYARYPHMFSGGQRQRIAIARALMLDPKVVVADEPVSALDVSIQAQVLNLLLDLQDELGLAYVFISHDLSVVRRIAHQVMVMYLGKPVEQGPASVVFSTAVHPYTRALLASTPHVDPARRQKRIALQGELPSPLNPPGGCAFHTRCPFATGRCTTHRPQMRELAGRLVACHHAETLLD